MKTSTGFLIVILLLISGAAMSRSFSFDNNNFLPAPVNHGVKSDSAASSSNEISNACEVIENDNNNADSKQDSVVEIKKNYFAIEQSINANDFMQVGVVITGGSSRNVHNYSINDDDACKTVFYYRLSNIDIADSQQLWHIKWMKVDDDKVSGIVAYPNIAGTELNIKLEKSVLYKITINTPDERIFSEQVYSDENGIVKPGISYMPNGVYLINVDSGNSLFSFLYLKR